MKKQICGIEVDVIRKNVKAVRIKIDREGNVTLIIPNRCSENAGVDFFTSKLSWVNSKLQNKTRKRELSFAFGEEVYIFGEKYFLAKDCSIKKWQIKDKKLYLSGRVDLKQAYEKVLKELLILKSQEHFAKWESITGLKKSSLTIRRTISRWGSCNSLTGSINLSLYLACLPAFCLDYVVLHEICHIKYSNHGEYFKKELDKFMPNWKQVRKFMQDRSNEYLYK